MLALHTCYLLLALAEFFLINWVGNVSISSGYHQISFVQRREESPLFNVVFRALAPSIFLVITAAIWYSLGVDGIQGQYWFVTVYYFGVRWLYNIVMGRRTLLNWPKLLTTAVLATAISVVATAKVLNNEGALLPTGQALTDQLWIIVIGFLYLAATKVQWPSLGPSVAERKAAFIRASYAAAKRRYGSVIVAASDDEAVEALSYSVLIYESFNRPRPYQLIEIVLLFPSGLADTLGPMQVQTQTPLPDVELVRLGIDKLKTALSTAFAKAKHDYPRELSVVQRRNPETGIEAPYSSDYNIEQLRFADISSWHQQQLVHEAAADYNIRSDYPGEIAGIFAVVRDTFYPQLNSRSRQALKAAG